MKHSCNTFTQVDEKGIAGQARNDSSLRMKKINLKEISKIMSENEMKDVKGGMDDRMIMPDDQEAIVAGGGGGGGSCTLKCHQDYPSTFHNVADCSRATAEAVCGDSFNPPHTICVC